MLLSSEYRTIVNECRDKLKIGICEDSSCNNCTIIHSAYFLRHFIPLKVEQIELILGRKQAQVSAIILEQEAA